MPIARALIGNRSAVVIKTPAGDVKERKIPAGTIELLGENRSVKVDVDDGADKIMKAVESIPCLLYTSKVINGELSADDMRIAPETLEMQAQVAESVHREAFAGNLRRAAELIAVPDDRLLEIYNALRPYRSTKQELLDVYKRQVYNRLDILYSISMERMAGV